MKDRREGELDAETCAAYLDGELDPARRAEVEAVLAREPRARAQLEAMEGIARALSAPAPELDDFDLVAAVHRGLAQPEVPPLRPKRLRWAVGLAAAAALVAVSTFGLRSLEDDEFRAKSAGAGGSEAERWSAVAAFRTDGKPAEPLGAQLRRGEGLAFSYTNLGPRPFAYLMVFAVDARGEVRWFHPAFEAAGQDPSSIAIQRGAQVPLRERIEHDYAAGPLTVHALFTRMPLRVSQVEAWLREGHGTLATAALADASHQVVARTVVAP